MKKTLIFLSLIFVFAFSCKKTDNSPTYQQEKLNGTWENVVVDENGCKNQLIITATSMKEKTECASSSMTYTYDSYSFDGKKITVSAFGFDADYVINELTDSTLVMTLMGDKIEYKKL